MQIEHDIRCQGKEQTLDDQAGDLYPQPAVELAVWSVVDVSTSRQYIPGPGTVQCSKTAREPKCCNEWQL